MARAERLYIWQKLTLLGLAFAILFAVPTALFLSQVASELGRSMRELAGLERAAAARALMQSLSGHRALASALLAGEASAAGAREDARKEVDARFESLAHAVRDDSRSARLATPRQS